MKILSSLLFASQGFGRELRFKKRFNYPDPVSDREGLFCPIDELFENSAIVEVRFDDDDSESVSPVNIDYFSAQTRLLLDPNVDFHVQRDSISLALAMKSTNAAVMKRLATVLGSGLLASQTVTNKVSCHPCGRGKLP